MILLLRNLLILLKRLRLLLILMLQLLRFCPPLQIRLWLPLLLIRLLRLGLRPLLLPALQIPLLPIRGAAIIRISLLLLLLALLLIGRNARRWTQLLLLVKIRGSAKRLMRPLIIPFWKWSHRSGLESTRSILRVKKSG
jgi:hypothetical protein